MRPQEYNRVFNDENQEQEPSLDTSSNAIYTRLRLEGSESDSSESEDDADLGTTRSIINQPQENTSQSEEIPIIIRRDSADEYSVDSSSAASSPPGPSTERALSVTESIDGVFSNLSAKPEVVRPAQLSTDVRETEPTTRQAVNEENPPEYSDVIIDESGLLRGCDGNASSYDKLPLGNLSILFLTLLVSGLLQWPGFIICYFMHTTHAMWSGALGGLGITFLQTGFALRTQALNYQLGIGSSSLDDIYVINPSGSGGSFPILVIGHVFMSLGWLILIPSIMSFLEAAEIRYNKLNVTPSQITNPMP